MKKPFPIAKYLRIPWYKQALAWLFLIAFYFKFKELILGSSFVGNGDFALYVVFTIAFFYLNLLWLLPRYVGFGPKFYYKLILFLGLEFMALMLLVILISIPLGGIEIRLKTSSQLWLWISNFFHISFLFFQGFLWSGVGYVLLWSFYNSRKSTRDMNRLKRVAQINKQNWLKASLNPHMLYNIIPMLEYTVEFMPEKASEALKILNRMMVYYLRNAHEGLIPILDEVQQAKNLIALNHIRSFKKANLKIELSGDLKEIKTIPMLVLLLVENIFKYGVLDDPNFPAKLRIALENNILSIRTENKINNMKSEVSTGIGLQNLKERLDHFYPDKHSFKAEAKGDVFVVALELEV